jgi:hypothetical protein
MVVCDLQRVSTMNNAFARKKATAQVPSRLLLKLRRSTLAKKSEVFSFDLVDSEELLKQAAHRVYLDRMVSEKVISTRLARRAWRVWELTFQRLLSLKGLFRYHLPVPAATCQDEGGPVRYYWEAGDHQLSVEIDAHEDSCTWVYRDRRNNTIWGCELPAASIPAGRLLEILLQITKSSK